MDSITPCLWFDGQAEEAANFYATVFDDAEITFVSPGPDGSALLVGFRIGSQPFQALNGGPQFPFTEAISLVVPCDGQEEVDRYWDALVDGGQESQCGWLKDRFGVSWQIVPKQLGDYLGDPDPERAARAMEAMLKMRKLDLGALKAAADGTSAG
jgi:predicted 3-demethylubiquinone-9 3-methyltransferase (glyoxalase superfamily)